MDNKTAFKREYLCQWIQNKEYDKAYELWLYYYYITEKYDQEHCSGKDKNGIAIPINSSERRESGRYSREIYEYISFLKKEWEYDNNIQISDKDWQRPKQKFNGMTFKGLEMEYNAIINNRKE